MTDNGFVLADDKIALISTSNSASERVCRFAPELGPARQLVACNVGVDFQFRGARRKQVRRARFTEARRRAERIQVIRRAGRKTAQLVRQAVTPHTRVWCWGHRYNLLAAS